MPRIEIITMIDDDSPLAPANLVEVDASNFEEEVLNSPELALVERRADWCSMCKALKPILKPLAEEKQGEIKVATVNVEQNEPLSDDYSIRAIPALLVFHRGVVQESVIGKTTEYDLPQLLRRYL